jgi:hypothetical protein
VGQQHGPDGTALVTVNSLALMKTNAPALRKVWFEVAMANKALLARHTLKAASILWKFTPPDKSYFFCYYDGITENDLGLKSETRLPRLRPLVNEAGYRLLEPGFSWIFFRPALPLYLILFLVLLTALRHHSPLLLLPAMPILGHAAGLFISCPVQDTAISTRSSVAALFAMHFRFRNPPAVARPPARRRRWLATGVPRLLTGSKKERADHGPPCRVPAWERKIVSIGADPRSRWRHLRILTQPRGMKRARRQPPTVATYGRYEPNPPT